jgi:TIR domain
MLESMQKRSGNFATFLDDQTVNMIMTDTSNGTFIWPTRKIIDQKWSRFVTPINFNVFLSHKSSDKMIARRIRNFLSSSEISVWFDEEEILPGMSVIDSISSGLSKSRGCIALISDDFLQSITRWTKMEINYFVGLLGSGEDNYIIPILVGITYLQLPPFLQDIRALVYEEERWEEKLLSAIKRHDT